MTWVKFKGEFCFLLGLELFHKNEVGIVCKALIIEYGTGTIGVCKIVSEITKVLKQMLFLQK